MPERSANLSLVGKSPEAGYQYSKHIIFTINQKMLFSISAVKIFSFHQILAKCAAELTASPISF